MLLLSPVASDDNIKKWLTCAHSSCGWPNVFHAASVSTNTVTPGILSVQQHDLMLPSEQWTVCWLGMSSTSSGFHLKAKENQCMYKEGVHWTQFPATFPRINSLVCKHKYMNNKLQCLCWCWKYVLLSNGYQQTCILNSCVDKLFTMQSCVNKCYKI